MAAVSAVSAVPTETTGGNGAGAYRCGVAARAAGTTGGAVAEDDALATVAGGPAGSTVVAGAADAVGDGARVTAGPPAGPAPGFAEERGAAAAAGAAGGSSLAGVDRAVLNSSASPAVSAGTALATGA